MTKTKMTRRIERTLWRKMVAEKKSTYGAFEVTVGYVGQKVRGYDRADFVTMDTNGIVRAYEIKTSVEDFYSDAELSWCGDYNYFALTQQVYDEVKDSRPLSWTNVGVYVLVPSEKLGDNLVCVKSAKKNTRSLGQRAEVMESMLKAASRDAGKLFKQDSYWR